MNAAITVSPRQMEALEKAILKRGNLKGITATGIRAALKEAGIDAAYDGINELKVIVDWRRDETIAGWESA